MLRGPPGSGKSTLAQQIAAQCGPDGAVVCSSDDFFVDSESGQYNFNHSGLAKAHVWNQERG